MRLLKRLFKDTKGYSLVELIVTIAIMSIVTAGIGAAVVSATKNYNKGTSEVNLQTAGQNASNILTNMIIDSVQACSTTDGGSAADANNLYIKDVNGKCYAIKLGTDLNPNGTVNLMYGEGASFDEADANATRVLVENVVKTNGFVADTSMYKANYEVRVTLDLDNPGSNRQFRSSFTVASRNAQADGQYVDNLDGAVIISESLVVIEPNEQGDKKPSLNVACKVITSGSVTDTGVNFTVVDTPDDSKAAVASNNLNGTCGLTVSFDGANLVLKANQYLNSSSGNLYIKVSTNAKNASGQPYDSKWVTVNIRRVNTVSITKDRTASSQTTNKAGSVHVITGKLAISNGDRIYALESDNDYDQTDATPYDVVWTVSCVGKQGHNLAYYISKIESSTKGDVTSQMLSSEGYYGKSGETFTITLQNDLSKSEVITFRASAVHPKGSFTYNGSTLITNKASLAAYGLGTKSYPCEDALYKISAGLFDEISDYQRGNVLNKQGFTDSSWGGIFNTIFKDLYDEYNTKDPNACDENGVKYGDLIKHLDSFKSGSYSSAKVGYFYRIKDYNKDLNGDNISDEGWSQYRKMGEGTNYNFTKWGDGVAPDGSGTLSGGMTHRLNADSYQSVEFVAVIYEDTPTSKVIYWPYYEDLMDCGFGPYANKCGYGFTFSPYAKSLTEDESSYMTTFDIVPATIEYTNVEGIFDLAGSDEMIGSTYDPLVLGDGKNDIHLEYDQINWVGLDYKVYQSAICAQLQINKKDGNGWKATNLGTNGIYGQRKGLSSSVICNDGGFKVGTDNHSYTFDTMNVPAGTDQSSVFRIVPIIYKWKVAYIKNEDQIFSDKIYYDDDHTFTYMLTKGNLYDDPLTTSVTFSRYGGVKTLALELQASDAVCSQTSVTFVAGQPISLPTPTRTGYIFKGWFDRSVGGTKVTSSTTNISGDKLWAQWLSTSENPVVIEGGSYTTYKTNMNINGVWTTDVTCKKYTYKVTNYKSSGTITFTVTVSDDAISPDSTPWNCKPSTQIGNMWIYNVDANVGETQTITVYVYGSVTDKTAK